MQRIALLFLSLCALSSYGQEDDICLNKYIIRDTYLISRISDTLASSKLIEMKKIGYMPVLYIELVEDCIRIGPADTIKRECIKFTLNMERVSKDIAFRRVKVGYTELFGERIFLILYSENGLVGLPYPQTIHIEPSELEIITPAIKIFSLVFNGSEYLEQ